MTLFEDGSTGASRPNICYRCTYVLKQRKKSIANPNSNPNPNRGHSRPRVSRFCGPTFYFTNILANHPFLQDGPTSLRAQDRSTRLLTPPGVATVIGRIVPSEQQRQDCDRASPSGVQDAHSFFFFPPVFTGTQ